MIRDSSSERIAEKIRALIAGARDEARKGDVRRAEDLLEDARDTSTSVADVHPQLPEVRALAFAESALLYQQLGNLHAARAFFRKAERFARDAPEERRAQAALMRASTLVNLIGVHARLREFDDGRAVAREALDLIRAEPDMEGAAFLRLGALQNGAAVELQGNRPDNAGPMLEEAVAEGIRLLGTGAAGLLPQVLDAHHQLARVRAHTGDRDGARAALQQAARLAELRYDAGEEAVWPLVVSAHIALAQLEFAARRLAETEDHLWKAVEVTRDARPIVQAATFYLDLLKLPDPVLTEGGLPRDEVIEAWSEIESRLDRTDLLPDAKRILAARFALLSRGETEGLDRWSRLDPADEGLESVVRELVRGLKDDLAWLRSSAGEA